VNSKATLRLPLSALLPLLPAVLRPVVSKSRYSAKDDLVIQADDSRKQNENVHRCFIKLNEMIVQAGREVVPGETSAEQMERVRKL
jgi:peptidyl-tRNA hydrolase ICT1